MELDDFLYTSAGRGRYACFTGTNRLMFITHRTNKYTELDEVKMVTKGGCTWVQLRMKENLNLEVAKAIAHFTLFDCDTDCACCLDDDLEMAFKAGIHCVHLGKNDIPVSEAWHRIIEKGKEDLFPGGGNSQHVRRYPESRSGRSFLHRLGPLPLHRDQKEPESGVGVGRVSKNHGTMQRSWP